LGLIALAALHGTAVAECPADHIDEHAAVAHVHDGDTLVLTDGRRVRLIGINTPELSRDQAPAEPYAQEARDALAALLQRDAMIGLRFDAERTDHYGRLLAHLYRADGESIQAWLLQRGYAMAIPVPPNLWNRECYRDVEERASHEGSGLWRLPYYRPLTSGRVAADVTGFRLVQGKVVRVGESKKSVWLNLEGGLALRIARTDLHYFPVFHPRDLVGRIVLARGWLTDHGAAPMMQIRHPDALHLLADEGAAR
jgi:endonuclease YncB( thermonuclease family)